MGGGGVRQKIQKTISEGGLLFGTVESRVICMLTMLPKWSFKTWHSSLVLIVLVKITRHYNDKIFNTVFSMEVFYLGFNRYKIK